MKKLLLFSTAIIFSVLMSAQDNWSLQNPYPLGNCFRDVHVFSEQRVVLASDEGLILQTLDAGAHWDTLFYDNDEIFNFRKIVFPDENTGWAMGNALIKTLDGGTSWVWAPTILNNGQYNDIFFLDQNTGYIAGKLDDTARVLMTMDGGQSWTNILSDFSLWSAFSVAFVNDSIGFVGGFCKAYKTMNGGISWSDMQLPINNTGVKWISFFDENNGYMGCDNSQILKTTDGGTSWDLCADPGIYFSSMYFKDLSTGWISGSKNGLGILKSTSDGGNTWDSCLVSNAEAIYAVDFYGEDFGWLVGDRGTVYNTFNGGSEWNKISGSMTAASLEDIHFIDQYTGWISCYGPNILLKTTDTGEQWFEIYDFGDDHVSEIVFTDEDNGWGYSGAKLFKTIDGGYSWDSIFSATHWGIVSMYAFDENKIFVTEDTCVHRSLDGGQTWEVVSISDTSSYYSEITFRENTGWITASKGSWWTYESNIYRSDDGGMNWYLLNISDDYSRLHFINQDTGFAVASHASWGGYMSTHIDKTMDGGLTWDVKYSTGGEYWCPTFHTIEFRDENNGWALSNSYALQTTDGGETWEHPDIQPNRGHDVTFTDVNNGWWINDFYLWKYHDNGMVALPEEPERESVSTLFVYPNPSSGAVNIQYSIYNIQYTKVELYSADGVRVRTLKQGIFPAGKQEQTFDISDLPDGMYFVRLQVGEMVETAKIVLLK